MRSITARQAARFLLLRQGLLGPRRFRGGAGALGFIRQAGSIQFDPIDVCGRNPDLVLQSRVEDYDRQTLSSLLYQERRLVDYFDKELCIFPAEDWPKFAFMRENRGGWMRSREEVSGAKEAVLREIGERGPLRSKDIVSNDRVSWFWGSTRLPRAVLEHLFYAGELGIHRREGSVKYYDLIGRCLPPALLSQPSGLDSEEALHRFLLLRRIGAVGLLWNRASPAWLGFPNFKRAQRDRVFAALEAEKAIVPLRVEGLRDSLYMLAGDEALLAEAAARQDFEPRCELITPLDNLMWDRALIESIFGFSYTWEIYAPPQKRVYGYYVLPLLLGERLIGRAEPVFDRKGGRLQLKGLWLEQGVDGSDPSLKAAIDGCLERFEAFHRRG